MRCRRWTRLFLALLAVAAVLHIAAAAEHQPPYDPRPLMQAADPGSSEAFTFAVFGDSYATPPLSGLLKMVSQRKPAFAVTTGDMVAKGSDDSTWATLSDRAGWFLGSIPTWPVIGNHELAGSRDVGAANFARFYDLPRPSYSFVFRGSKFIVLGYEPAGQQLAFLQAELASRSEYSSVFVFRHVPFYTIGSKSASEAPNKATQITSLLAKRKVTAVFTGHDHTYYRTKRDGVNYIISGSAGAPVYELRRLSERRPDDAYMGLVGGSYVLHTPKGMNERVSRKASPESDWLFAVFVHVNGARITAETVSRSGETWERFEF
jgi:hypothetical protein